MNKSYSFLFGVITCLIVMILGYFGFRYYENNKKNPIDKKNNITEKLKPLTSEEIFNKYQDAVVLIKHSYFYKINLFGQDYYFREFDSKTGQISGLISYEEAKNNPIESWGTGFFIDNNGSIITNRHVVDVRPTAEEQKQILIAFKQELSNLFSLIKSKHFDKGYELQNIRSRINSGYLDEYEHNNLVFQFNNLREEYSNEEGTLLKYDSILQNFDFQNNYVTKTSTQFGIFLNKQHSSNLNDYIQYKSVKISADENVDLALLKPINSTDLRGRKFTVANMSKVDSLIVKHPKITQKVIMIGYNHGIVVGNTLEGIKPQLTEGNISQVTDKYKMMYTIPALHGSSGSPIFDVYGRVIGVNFAGATNSNQNFNYGIQTQQIKSFLYKN